MYVKLTLPERLKDLRKDAGLTLEELAVKTGLSRSALGRYETDDFKDFSPYAITRLSKFYGVSTDYLLGRSENLKSRNESIEELHLNDETIDVLKSGKLNNRLVCELITHPLFPVLLYDLTISIDRIADISFKALNQQLDMAHQAVLEKYEVEDPDSYMQMIDRVGQMDEEIFFSGVYHDDMDAIVNDLREAHRDDITTADEFTFDEETWQEVIENARSKEKSSAKVRSRAMCTLLQIDYDRLPEDQQTALDKILSRSPLMIDASNMGKKAPLLQDYVKPKKKK